MTHFKHYRSGKIYGVRYDFDEPGDGIPHHDHGTDLAHNIVVMKGSIILDIAGDRVKLEAGDIYDFDWTKRHAESALESRTSVLHIFLNGRPRDYETLPPSALAGEGVCRVELR